MDEPIEVGNDVGVEVVDDAYGELRGDAFEAVDLGVVFMGEEFAEEEFALHVEVVAGEFGEFLVDLGLFLLDEFGEALPGLPQHHTHEVALLEADALDVVLKTTGACEFLLELLAPLGQDAENLRTFDFEAVGVDFIIGEEPRGFWKFPAYFVVGVLPDLFLIVGLLLLLDLGVLILEHIFIHGVLLLKGVVEGDSQHDVRVHVLIVLALPTLLRPPVHPLVVPYRFKQKHHLLLELLVDGLATEPGLDAGNGFVERAHDEVVVLPGFPQAEVDGRAMKVVLSNIVCIVKFTDSSIEVPVDLLAERHGVFAEHVLKHTALQMGINNTEILCLQAVLLT